MKKFTLLLAAALTMSAASAKTLNMWEGEVDFNTSGDYEITSKVPYTSIEYGDKLVFHFTNVSTDADNPGQLTAVAKDMDDSWTWTEFISWQNIDGDKYEYTFEDVCFESADGKRFSDYTVLEMLQGRNYFSVKGKNATLVSIDFVTASDVEYESTVIFEGAVEFGAWAKKAEIPAAKFANAKVGDKLQLTFTNVASGAQVSLEGSAPDADWTWTKIVPYADIVNDQYIYSITDKAVGDNAEFTFLEIAQAAGIQVGGQKATLVKAEILSRGGEPTPPTPPTPAEGIVIWEGNEPLDNAEVEITGKFADLEYGDKIVCVFTNVSKEADNPGQVTLATKDIDNDWTWTEFVAWQNIEGDTFSYTLVDEAFSLGDKFSDNTILEMLQGRDVMFVKGKSATLTQVLIQKASGAIDRVEAAVDFNAPVEIYTIDGRRVAEMEKGRIYIVRQGSNVVKMVK